MEFRIKDSNEVRAWKYACVKAHGYCPNRARTLRDWTTNHFFLFLQSNNPNE